MEVGLKIKEKSVENFIKPFKIIHSISLIKFSIVIITILF